MGLRIHASAEVRKGGSMSKAPDLSAFPIPRKGGARPIEVDEALESVAPTVSEEKKEPQQPVPLPTLSAVPEPPPTLAEPRKSPPRRRIVEEPPNLATSGQTVATTVKLDEDRYLRLADAGRPGPGRLKRRTIQDMVIEALDEWFEKRGL
jgi:hypothetical protein